MKRIRDTGFTLLELTVVLLILVALAGVVIPYTQGTVEQAACQATDATLAAVKEAIMGSGAGPGYYSDMGDYPAPAANPNYYSLRYLFLQDGHADFNPSTARGWRGPYLQGGGTFDKTKADASFQDTTSHIPCYTSPCTNVPNAALIDGDPVVFDSFTKGGNRSPVILQVYDDGDGINDCAGGAYPDKWCARLVSAGPDGILNTTFSDFDAANRGDDRVLFLKIPDPFPQGNQPCTGK